MKSGKLHYDTDCMKIVLALLLIIAFLMILK